MIHNFFKKYKTEIIILLSSFLLYFFIGIVFSYYLGIAKFWNVLFDLDTPRVIGDLSIRNFNHYRTSVHPLFVIIFQPIVLIVKQLIHDPIIVILLLQSLLSAISLTSIYEILKKMGLKRKSNILLTLLFGLSFGQIVFTSNIETYIFAQFFLVLLWLFTAFKIDKKFKFWDYIIIVLLGVGSLAITITNFVQFLIVLVFLILFNKNMNHKFLTCVFVTLSVIAFSVLAADVQNIIWPTAPNFFTKGITDLIYGTSEEKLYVDMHLSITKIINVINCNFSDSFNLSSLVIPSTGTYLTFFNNFFRTFISVILFLLFGIFNIYYIIKSKFNIKKDKLYYALLLTYIFNFCFHLIYGNSIAFLYISHYNFVIILLIGYIIKSLDIKLFENKLVFILLCVVNVFLLIRMVYLLFIKLAPVYNPVDKFGMLPILIICIVSILLMIIAFKRKLIITLLSLIIILISFICYNKLNVQKNICNKNCNIFEKYSLKLEKYNKQLKDMKNSFMVKTYEDVDKPINIFYFGMADRRKLVYKSGKIIDAKTKEIIKKFDYDKELIIPNEYTVLLKDKANNIIKIIENEDGVYCYENNNKTVLSEGSTKINLPEFDDKKYSEILKVLHQEILFNIDGSEPKPNIFGYSQAYYRDAMLGTMVLEDTKNIDLILDWVNSIQKIYDNSRSSDINEVDNLGELLYIIGATKSNRTDLVKIIIDEINSKKQNNGSINGMVDGSIQSYYPTVLALYGAQKLGIHLDLSVPKIDDGYAKLTWYTDYEIASNNFQKSKFYPYINWGFYHYAPYGDLYILDEIYPLSYEGGEDLTKAKVDSECFISEYYCEKEIYLSHMWHAAEMYLYLKQY